MSVLFDIIANAVSDLMFKLTYCMLFSNGARYCSLVLAGLLLLFCSFFICLVDSAGPGPVDDNLHEL